MVTHCLNCKKALSDKRGGAKFCSQDCKNKYSYQQRTGQLNGFKEDNKEAKENPLESSLRGVIEDKASEGAQVIPINRNPGSSIDSEFVKDLLSRDIFNVDNKLENAEEVNEEQYLEYTEQEEESKTDPVNNTLPEKYISKEVQISDFSYICKKIIISTLQSRNNALALEYKKLKDELKFQQERKSANLTLIGGVTGGLLAFLETPSLDAPGLEDLKYKGMTLRDKYGKKIPLGKKKKKPVKNIPKKDSSPSFLGKLFEVVLFGALGAGAGYITENANEAWLQNDRKQKISVINKRMAEIGKEYHQQKAKILEEQNLLKQLPEFTTEIQQVPNPEYEKALNGLSGLKLNFEESKNKNLKKGFRQTEPIKFKSDKIIKATDLGKREFKALNFDGLWREFIGLPSINFHALIHGNSGEGKSTFCLWFARYLAENFGRVLYVSGEEGLNMTFHDKLKYCQAEVENFYILDVRTGDEFMQEVGENEFHFVILDSLHDMEIDARKMKVIFERYKNTGFICIDQNNKKGELLGANEKKHIVDFVVNVKNYTAETTKNRFKAKGEAFKTADFTENPKTKGKPFNLKKKDKDDDNGYELDSDRRGLV